MDMHEMNPQDKPGRVGQMLLAAAMSLPLVQPAQADTPPERGVISFKYLDYQDWQPGQDRISVTAPAFSLVAPIGEAWSFEAGVVRDAVSGASPAFHTSPLGFQRMDDVRWAENAGVTRYFERGSVTAGLSHSREALNK